MPGHESVLDLHCHTVLGSTDSQLKPQELAQLAVTHGLTACCISEHDNVWDRHAIAKHSDDLGIPFIPGMEVTTNLGHILVYGLDGYVSGIRDARVLRQVTRERGAIMIAAHPLRNRLLPYRVNGGAPTILGTTQPAPPPTIEQAAEMEIFTLVDEVEVLNGGTSDLENYFALRVAGVLGFRGVACSDAHSTHGVGRFATVFERPIRTAPDLAASIRERSFYPAQARTADGPLQAYGVSAFGEEWEERLEVAIKNRR